MSLLKRPASYSKGVLAVDAAKSKMPGIVRVDLSSQNFTHFYVRVEEGGAVLGYEDGSARFTPLASFVQKEDADRLLKEIQKRLIPFTFGQGLKLFLIGAVGMFFFLGFIDWAIGLRLAQMNAAQVQTQAQPQPPATPGAPRAGTPVDADSLFNNNGD